MIDVYGLNGFSGSWAGYRSWDQAPAERRARAPDAPSAHFGLLRRSRLSQAGALVTAFGGLPPMPMVLLGDLNEWRRRKRSSLSMFEPLFGEAHPLPSFPSRRPMFPLDRIFGWPRGLIHRLAVHDTPLARKASDHLPLTAEADVDGQGLAARQGDRRHAEFSAAAPGQGCP